MRLKLTLARHAAPAEDIVITTDATATVADIASAIAASDPYRVGTPQAALTLSVTPVGSSSPVLLPEEKQIVESTIGSGFSVAVVPAPNSFTVGGSRGPTAAVLRVKSGPDAGREFSLPLGTSIIGRDADADIVLADPLVSKRHARIEVGSTVEIADLNSANGLLVDGGLVSRLTVQPGQRVLAGGSDFEISLVAAFAQQPTEIAEVGGSLPFNRSPRVETRYPGTEYARPDVPSDYEKPPFPWIAMVAPIIAGGAMFLFTKNPLSLAFVALSPIMMMGNFLSTRMNRRKRHGKTIHKFDEQLEVLQTSLAGQVEVERAARNREAPSTLELFTDSLNLGGTLWTRRYEHWSFLNLRLGLGTARSRNRVAGAGGTQDGLPEFSAKLDELIETYRDIDGVPILENPMLSGGIGVAGAGTVVADAARNYLVQLITAHSPSDLVVAALVSPAWSAEFEWLKWIPHTSSALSPIGGVHLADSAASGAALLSALEDVVSSRLGRAAEGPPPALGPIGQEASATSVGEHVGTEAGESITPLPPLPAMVILVSDDAPVDRARLVQLVERGSQVGIYPLWVAPTVSALPAVCRTFIDVSAGLGSAVAGFVRLGSSTLALDVEGVSHDSAMRLGRRLAAVIDAGSFVADSSDLPASVSFLSLVGADMAESPASVLDRWTQNDSIHDRSGGPLKARRRVGKLRALVGQAGAEAMHLDLRTQGPHALVGGTTGSGKSEFLQAWVLGMAAEYSPDRVTFLFVDYKGGSAFADCIGLPHSVGLVTDLSPHLVRRALTSLRAELHYRERLFAAKKAKDLLDLEKSGDPDSPPALVLVIDEFAALVGEVPEFVDGVVDIAQRGRSLGIHLIMATQRPAGVIKDNLRANTNLRIALRMADESDSSDVVGDSIAASFSPSIPGRAIAKTGPGRLTGFQTGYAGGWTTSEPAKPSIQISALRFGAESLWEADIVESDLDTADPGPTDQARLVTAIAAASVSAGIPEPRRPWQDELGDVYELGKIRQRTDTELVIGVADMPEHQRQEPVYFRPDDDGNLAVFGTGGSGKSTVLRTLAAAAAITPRGGPVDVYGLDFATGSLRMLEELPHVGSVVNGDDSERVIRLLRFLKATLDERSQRYSQANAGTITDYRAISGKRDEARILLLLDGYPNFRNEYETVTGRTGWYSVFQQILNEGRQAGIHVAITADRPGSVPSSISSSIQRRVVMRLAEETMYSLLDVPTDILGPKSPAGRAIVDEVEVQVAVLGGSRSVAEQSRATARLAASMVKQGRIPAVPIGSLPREYLIELLPSMIEDRPALGISDDKLEAVGFEPVGAFLLGGGPGSGRSNALAAIAASVARWDPDVELYYLGNRRSALPSRLDFVDSAVTVDEVASLAKELSARVSDPDETTKITVIVESLSDFMSTPADAAIVELTKAIKRSDHLIIAESESSSWASSWPLMSEIKNARRGILLQPDALEGDTIMRTSFPRVSRSEFPPGRGFYVQGGKVSRVQMPIA